jgi:hypothetical protein
MKTQYFSQKYFPLACLCAALAAAVLSGCAGRLASESYVRNPLPAQEMVSAIAEDAAAKLATIYPPGHTRLALVYPLDSKDRRIGDAFSQSLEDGLRKRGFTIAPAAGLRLTWTLDALPGKDAAVASKGQEEMAWWYLRLKLADADKFETRTLTRMYGADGLPLAGFAESGN